MVAAAVAITALTTLAVCVLPAASQAAVAPGLAPPSGRPGGSWTAPIAATGIPLHGGGSGSHVIPRPVQPAGPTIPTPTIASCPLFPADNPWREDVSHLPLSPYSSAWVASIGSSGHLHPDFGSDPTYGIPYSVVPAGQVKVAITFTAYGDQSDPGPYPIPASAAIESGSDRHVLVASGDCKIYELYGAARSGSGWKAASGAVFDLTSDALRPAGWTSADAAGLPILPGLVRPDEIASGHIDHALRFTVNTSQTGHISPATHDAGSTASTSVPPMGARFRLKASYDISHFHGASLVILQTLKTYGMFVADNGSNWYLSGATYTGWDDDDLNQLKSVPGSAFEAVNTGPVQH
jgi:hypothetical protein